MYCPFCGNNVEQNATQCPKCGGLLSPGSAATAQPVANAQYVQYAAAPVDSQLKSKIVAGILGIVLGGFGVHRFYLGFVGIGLLQILVTFLTCGIGTWWGVIEGILILTGSINRDAQGRPLRD